MWKHKSNNTLQGELWKIFETKFYQKDPRFFLKNSLYQKNSQFFEVFVSVCQKHNLPFEKLVFLAIYEYSKSYLTDNEIKHLFIENLKCGSIEQLKEYLDIQLDDGAIFKEDDSFFYRLLAAYEKIIFPIQENSQGHRIDFPQKFFNTKKFWFLLTTTVLVLLSLSFLFPFSSPKEDEISNLQERRSKNFSESSPVPTLMSSELVSQADNDVLQENEEMYRSLREEKTTLPEQKVDASSFDKEYTPQNSLTDDYHIIQYTLNKSLSGYFRGTAQPKFLQTKNTVSALDLPLKPVSKEDLKEQKSDANIILSFTASNELINLPVPYGYSAVISNKGNLLKNDDHSYFLKNAKGDVQVTLQETQEHPSFFSDETKEFLPLSDEVKQFVQTILKDSNQDQKVFVEKIKSFIQAKQYDKRYQGTFVQQAKNTMDYFNILYKSPKLECYSANLLFVAMLREAGISARIVSGFRVNYSNKITNADGHAWTEVFLNNQWEIADVTPVKNDTMQSLKQQKQEEKVKVAEKKLIEKIEKEKPVSTKNLFQGKQSTDELFEDFKKAKTREEIDTFFKIINALPTSEYNYLYNKDFTDDLIIKWNFIIGIQKMKSGDYSGFKSDNTAQMGLHYASDVEWSKILSVLPQKAFIQCILGTVAYPAPEKADHLHQVFTRNTFEIPKKIIETSHSFSDIYTLLSWSYFQPEEKDFLYSYFFLKRGQDLDTFSEDNALSRAAQFRDTRLFEASNFLLAKKLLQKVKAIEDLSQVPFLEKDEVLKFYIGKKLYKNISAEEWKRLFTGHFFSNTQHILEYNDFEVLDYLSPSLSGEEILTALTQEETLQQLSPEIKSRLASYLDAKKVGIAEANKSLQTIESFIAEKKFDVSLRNTSLFLSKTVKKILPNTFYQNINYTFTNFLTFLLFNFIVFLIWKLSRKNTKFPILDYVFIFIFLCLLMSLQSFIEQNISSLILSVVGFLYFILIMQKNREFLHKHQGKLILILVASGISLFLLQNTVYIPDAIYPIVFITILVCFIKYIPNGIKRLPTILSDIILYFSVLTYFVSIYRSVGYSFWHTITGALGYEFFLFFGLFFVHISVLLLIVPLLRSDLLDFRTQYLCQEIDNSLQWLKNKHRFFTSAFINKAKYYPETEWHKTTEYLNSKKQVFPDCSEIQSKNDSRALIAVFYCQFPHLFSSLKLDNINNIARLDTVMRTNNESLLSDTSARLELIVKYFNGQKNFDSIIFRCKDKKLINTSWNEDIDYIPIIESAIHKDFKQKISLTHSQENPHHDLFGKFEKSDNYFFDKASEEDPIHTLDYKKTDQLGMPVVRKYFPISHHKNVRVMLVLNLLTIESKKFWKDLAKFLRNVEQKNISVIDIWYYSAFKQKEFTHWEQIKAEDIVPILQKSLKKLFDTAQIEKVYMPKKTVSNVKKEEFFAKVQNLFFAFGYDVSCPSHITMHTIGFHK